MVIGNMNLFLKKERNLLIKVKGKIMRIKINNKEIRQLFSAFFYNELHGALTHITDIKVYKHIPFLFKKKYDVVITAHRPGMIIGPYGYTIKRLEDFLRKNIKSNVKNPKVNLYLFESKLWKGLY